MVKPADLNKEEHVLNMGWGKIAWLYGEEIDADGQMTFGMVYINAGEENGRHLHPNCEEIIFVEKPFADTYSDAKSIAEEAERRQIPVSVNQNFRKHHKFDFIRGLIQEGIVGKLEGIHFSSLFYRQDKGWRVNTERHALAVMSIH